MASPSPSSIPAESCSTNPDPLAIQVKEQAEIAMTEADVILFVVDAADGMTGSDQDLAKALRGSKNPLLLVVNKVDNKRMEMDAAEFYALGLGEVHSISALNGDGVADVLDKVVALFPDGDGTSDEEDDAIRISIIGRPNVGKSSLLNAILGEDRVIVSPIPGTTRDPIDTEFVWEGEKLVFVDTAGIRRSGKVQGSVEFYMVLRAQAALERCNVGMVVIDAEQGILDGDKRVAGLAQDAGRACIVVVNKWDLVDPGVIYEKGKPRNASKIKMLEFTQKFRDECPFIAYAPLVFVSAQERFSIRHAVETAITAAQNHAFRIPTGELNRIIQERHRTSSLRHERTRPESLLCGLCHVSHRLQFSCSATTDNLIATSRINAIWKIKSA